MEMELTPSPNGEKCIANGQHEDVEIACDECDFFLECYSISEQFDKPDFKNEI